MQQGPDIYGKVTCGCVLVDINDELSIGEFNEKLPIGDIHEKLPSEIKEEIKISFSIKSLL